MQKPYNSTDHNDNYINDNDDKSFNEDELKAILRDRINDDTNDILSLKYLFKLLKFYKLEHYMSDLIDYGYRTAISLNQLEQTDLDNLNVSAYDLKKFTKLQAFIKQVMHTLKVNTVANIQLKPNLNPIDTVRISNGRVVNAMPLWESKPQSKPVNSQPTDKYGVNHSKKRSKSVDSKVTNPREQPNSVHHLSMKSQMQANSNQHFGPKLFNSKQIQFVEMKAYNYGVPKVHEAAKKPSQRGFLTSRSTKSMTSEPSESSSIEMADIYVFARKRPKLACEMKFNDVIAVQNQSTIVLNESRKAVDGTDILRQVNVRLEI